MVQKYISLFPDFVGFFWNGFIIPPEEKKVENGTNIFLKTSNEECTGVFSLTFPKRK